MIGLLVLSGAIMLVSRPQTPFPREARFALAISVAMLAVLGTWGTVTGIGLLRLRNWARISIVVFGVLLAFAGLASAPAILLIPAPPNVPQNFGAVRMVIAMIYGAFGLLGAVWLYYFNRRATCNAFGGSPSVESGRPLSISIIGWWLLIAGLGTMVATPFLQMPGTIFIWVMTGWNAVACYVAFGVLNVYAGYGLLRLNPIARRIAIWSLCFGVVNGAVFFCFPGRDARITALMSHSRFGSHAVSQPQLPPMAFMMPLMVIVLAVPLWFLITRKSAFERGNVASVA
jgi:hypothetical protein